MPKPNTINIAAVVPYRIFPAKMGGQKGIALFYEYLSTLAPVTLITTKNNDVDDFQGKEIITVLSNARSRYFNLLLFFKIRKLILRNGYSHMIFEHPYFGWLALLLKLFTKVKIIIHSHNIESIRFKSTGKWWWRLLWQYEKTTHRIADLNFYISDEDRDFAIMRFKLDPEKCLTITYGFEKKHPPSDMEKTEAGRKLRALYAIPSTKKILLFNGTLDYRPNLNALQIILDQINPLLLQKEDFHYTIIVCGKNLPEQLDELRSYSYKNIIYAGFVEDINLYFNGADIFLNPVMDGGGIKTKLVEALGYDMKCISTKNGAIGVPQHITNNQLVIVDNNDWKSFSEAIMKTDTTKHIGEDFFKHFYWGNIAQKALNAIERNQNKTTK
ncbi:MAG: glycosyltransferase family 4 protein [Ferruginibacter sp.]|nr:glycosyltransferase family 4 protein [Ferruginibacter sp.]